MFVIGTSELIVIAIIVFLIYGPDRLPEMVRKTSKFVKDIRQASEDVTGVIRREVNNFEVMTKYPNEPEPTEYEAKNPSLLSEAKEPEKKEKS